MTANEQVNCDNAFEIGISAINRFGGEKKKNAFALTCQNSNKNVNFLARLRKIKVGNI